MGLGILSGPVDVWIHGASVGENKLVSYLVDFLKKQHPSISIHVTVNTEAGYNTATAAFGDRVSISFFPVDLTGIMKRTFNSLKPEVIVLIEAELWPHLLITAGKKKIPVVLVNARMSERAWKFFQFFQYSSNKLFKNIDHFFFKSKVDAERYTSFNLPDSVCQLSGDMKFDAPVMERSTEKKEGIRAKLGVKSDDFLFIAGSTRHGEEEILADLFVTLRSKYSIF